MKKEIKGITAKGAVDHINNMCKLLGNDRVFFVLEEVKPLEPIIVKSGDTWVAEWKGIDYLCIEPMDYSRLTDSEKQDSLLVEDGVFWKRISEIEITDDIAKLRPIIRVYRRGEHKMSDKLVYVDETCFQLIDTYIAKDGLSGLKLATVKDLKEV